MSLPDLKPNLPIKGAGAASDRIETAKTLLLVINRCVKHCLLTLTATIGGSGVNWNTVFTMHPLSLSSSFELRMHIP
jgi:hypothetical protein